MTVHFADRLRYWTDWPIENFTLIVAIPAMIGTDTEDTALLLDTASDCCVISASNALASGWGGGFGLAKQKLSSRLGNFEGVTDRFDLTFRGFNKETLVIDATWLIIEDWPGPTVLGWRGGLERIQWAMVPMDNWFYFAAA
jgi:hypothetical protein